MSAAAAPASVTLRRLAPSLLAVGAIAALALLAPFVAEHDPVVMTIAERLKPPSWEHLLGRDEYGRDIFARLLHGARVSLAVAVVAASAAAVVGIAIGLVGGYFGGLTELFTVRVTDIVLSFPPMLLALLIVTVLGPGANTLALVLAILYTPGFARVTYGEVLSARSFEYVEAARALGASPARILGLTILPNIVGPLIVQFSLTVASAILIESGLSFLGLGVVPPEPSWGLMIRAARSYMVYSPLPLLWPCLALTLTVLAVNALCDALRDVYDPRARAQRGLRGAARSLVRFPVAGEGRGEGESGRMAMADDAVMSVRGLRTEFATPAGPFAAVDDVSLEVRRGETVAIVGESGSGKTMIGLSILRLVPEPHGTIAAGEIGLRTRGEGVLPIERLGEAELQAVRGEAVSMIFQEPMTSLNPVHPVGEQIAESLRHHRRLARAEASRQAVALLERVGIPDPARRARDYPHQLSGGMRQRVMIAIALACEPSLIVADEPTTALDVTVQAQILDLLRQLHERADADFALVFITHNLGVVADIADRVLVMYCGQIVEEGPVAAVFRDPRHPYTRGLLASIPRIDRTTGAREPLSAIPGAVPQPGERPPGCAFAPRCAWAAPRCEREPPPLEEIGPGRRSRCLRWRELDR